MAPVAGVLYTNSDNPRTLKILICANYSGAELELDKAFVFGKTNKEETFLEKFPLGKVPAFESKDGKALLFEGDAIAYYVCTPKFRGTDTPNGLTEVLEWISFSHSELNVKSEAERCLAVLNDHLLSRTYLVGDEVTLADISVFGVLIDLFQQLLDEEGRKRLANLSRWFDTVLNQPKVQDAMAKYKFQFSYHQASASAEEGPQNLAGDKPNLIENGTKENGADDVAAKKTTEGGDRKEDTATVELVEKSSKEDAGKGNVEKAVENEEPKPKGNTEKAATMERPKINANKNAARSATKNGTEKAPRYTTKKDEVVGEKGLDDEEGASGKGEVAEGSSTAGRKKRAPWMNRYPRRPSGPTPLHSFPYGKFKLFEFKEEFCNNPVSQSIPYFWENFQPNLYSIWLCEYKFNTQLTTIPKTCNLIEEMFQPLDKMRSCAFASMCVFGEDNNSTISGIWIFRGHKLAFTLSKYWQSDFQSYQWEKLNPRKLGCKKLINDYLTWQGVDENGRKFNVGKIFQ